MKREEGAGRKRLEERPSGRESFVVAAFRHLAFLEGEKKYKKISKIS